MLCKLTVLLIPVLTRAALPTLQSHTTAHGMTVLVYENHASALVTLDFVVRTGAMVENPETNGLAHLFEHMFFKGNAVVPDQNSLMARARDLGLVIGATTDTELVEYYFTTTSNQVGGAMAFMRDAVVSPLFDPAELAREAAVVGAEIDRAEANPAWLIWRAVLDRVWWRYPSRKHALGNRDVVTSATPEQLRELRLRFYVPRNSALIVSGDVTPAAVFDLADTLLGKWNIAGEPFAVPRSAAHPPIRSRDVVVVTQPVGTVKISFTWQGPSMTRAAGLDCAASLLGRVLHPAPSRFQTALVGSGKCVSAGMAWSPQVDVGPVTLWTEAVPAKARECVTAAVREIGRMAETDYFTEGELRDAAREVRLDDQRSRQRPSEYAHTLAFWWATAGLDYFGSYLDGLDEVTPRTLGDVVRTYLRSRPYVLGVLVASDDAARYHLDRSSFVELLGAEPEATGLEPGPGEVSR